MDEELATRIWQRKLNNLLKQSNLPKNYWKPQTLIPRKIDIDAWEYLEDIRTDIVNFVEEGNILVIASENVGNGKTSWGIRLLQRYLAESALDVRITDRGMFTNYAALVTDLGDFNYRDTPEFKETKKRLMTCELLVIDELGSAALNKVTYPVFYDIINSRSSNNLSTIYTTNFTDEYLQELFGERLYSRIYDSATVVIFNSSNVRGFTAEEVEDIEL